MSMLPGDTTRLLRRGLLGLAVLTIVGIVVELAVERHWTQPIQLVAWTAAVATMLAIILVAWAPSRARVRLAQLLAIIVLLSACLGIWEHLYANYDAGSLDYRYADIWDSLPEATRWQLALTKTVGPSPPLAAGALAQAGLAVLLATLRHPVFGERALAAGRVSSQ